MGYGAKMTSVFENRRITPELIRKSVNEARRRMPDKKISIIGDVPQEGVVTITDVDELPAADCFVLAFEQDDQAASAMKKILARNAVYFPCLQYYPVAEYWRTNFTAKKVLSDEHDKQSLVPDHKWNTPDFVNIIQAIEATRNVEGAFVEVGVFRGNSARVATRYMNDAKILRKCWFMDVFIGFNYEAAKSSVDRLWDGTHDVGPPEIVEAYIRESLPEGSPLDITVLKKNIITDDLPKIGKIAVANLDVDMYEAVLVGLQRLAPMMATGGILICEDAGHTPALSGAFQALTEFLESPASRDFTPLVMGSGQTFLLRTNRNRQLFSGLINLFKNRDQ